MSNEGREKNSRDINYNSQPYYFVGQKLYCTNGEVVILRAIEARTIIIEYKSNPYVRDKALLGTKLFRCNPLNEQIIRNASAFAKRAKELANKKKLERKRLKELAGQATNKSIIMPSSQSGDNGIFSDYEKDNWPKEMRYRAPFWRKG